MGHGFLGMNVKSWAFVIGYSGFLYYGLTPKFDFINKPKFEVDPLIADLAAEVQTGIDPKHYYAKPKNN